MAVEDLVIIGVSIFMLIIVGAVCALAASFIIGTPLDNTLSRPIQSLFDDWDKIVIMASVLFHLGILITAFLFRTHPAFTVIALMLLLLEVFILGNIFTAGIEVLSHSSFSTLKATPGLITFMQIQPIATLVFGMVLLIIQYGQPQGVR